jgi:tRNA-splicing ligase RtcB (3'-phosphate/5'-hydroxy nucleic acid ligase)
MRGTRQPRSNREENHVAYELIEGPRGAAPIKAWTRNVPVEEAAVTQLRNVAALPFIHHHVAVMPDVHWGMGATVGSVIATDGAIVPAAVGVDIGCGMMATRLSLTAPDLPDNLAGVRSAIEAAIPHGRTDNGGVNDRGAWREVGHRIERVFDPNPSSVDTLDDRLRKLVAKHPKLERAAGRARNHLGTLGTGNHFVEVCLDEEDRVWVMLHSGSRGIGNAIGQHFISLAKRQMERWFIHLPDKDLAYLTDGSGAIDDYIEAVGWAQDYALANRKVMMEAAIHQVITEVGRPDAVRLDEAVNCHHNYVNLERHFGKSVWVTRKGAVSARKDQLGIIPGSMGARSFIVRGKGNPDSFCSCSHGAGRAMSRGEARRRFTLSDHEAATAGVECRKDAEVIDETPAAYKSIDDVMAAQEDLVEVVHTLRQVVCVKG